MSPVVISNNISYCTRMRRQLGAAQVATLHNVQTGIICGHLTVATVHYINDSAESSASSSVPVDLAHALESMKGLGFLGCLKGMASMESTSNDEDSSEIMIAEDNYWARFQELLDQRSGDEESASATTEADIEASRVTWSEMDVVDDADTVEDIRESNKRVFEELRQRYPKGFFKAYSKSLVLGERIAAGGQAEILKVCLQWGDGSWHDDAFVFKVFRLDHANALRELQKSTPRGLLLNMCKQTGCYFMGNLWGASLLDDGRLAFMMQRKWGDMRKFIHLKMLANSNTCDPPFSNVAAYCYMRDIARNMEHLHKDNIVHRDLKAANVLVEWPEHWTGIRPRSWQEVRCQVADMEASAMVIGTLFHRAPEILRVVEAARRESRSVLHDYPDVFTKSADVYSFGVTCYEILTGREPFEGHPVSHYEPVYSGRIRLQWPSNLEPQAKQLLERCTSLLPSERPTFRKISRVLKPYVRPPFTW